MDASLRLLWRLRLRALFRRWGRDLRKPKGILLTIVGLLVFAPWMASIALTPRQALPWDPERARRFGPLVLLGYAAMTLLFSSGERVLFFTPAEIDFLFPGPFSRRALLAYKVAGAAFGILFSSVFLTLAFLRSSRNPAAAYAAIVLAMLFFQLLAMAVGLASNTVAAFAVGPRRKAVLAGLLGLVLATAFSAGSEALRLPPKEAWERVESSTALRVATLPFRPFIEAYTAASLAGALGWAAVCLAMDGAMLGVVFAIDAQYFETAAASSARIYAQLQRMRQGGGMTPGRGRSRAKPARSRLPMFPWWRGAGPVLWRQVATALRERARMALIAFLFVVPAGIAAFVPGQARSAQLVAGSMMLVAAYAALFFSAFFAFDFRGDVDRMEELKALPIGAVPLVIGQVATPVLVLCVPAWLGFAALAPWVGAGPADFAMLALIAPASALFIAIDNLLFLWFPTRSTQATVADFASMGRQVLLVLAKLLVGGLAIGLAALAGAGVRYGFGGGPLAAYLAAFVVLAVAAAALVPLLALAFRRYDVADDTPA
jgi:hypothetical protein